MAKKFDTSFNFGANAKRSSGRKKGGGAKRKNPVRTWKGSRTGQSRTYGGS